MELLKRSNDIKVLIEENIKQIEENNQFLQKKIETNNYNEKTIQFCKKEIENNENTIILFKNILLLINDCKDYMKSNYTNSFSSFF